jgi:ubiquinone biosynthesis protein COQ4
MLKRAVGLADRWTRRDWPAAWRAFRRLKRNPADLVQVFTIIRVLAGRSVERGYRRLLNTEQGGRFAYDSVELLPRLNDRAWMAGFGANSVAAAYLAFLGGDRSATALTRASRRGIDDRINETAHPYAWFGRRLRDTHDVWHVLTGYGHDPLSEACLTAFTYAQTGGLGWAFLAAGAALNAGDTHGFPIRRAIWEGYVRGRRAAWLLGEDYEALLAEPLDEARARLRLDPAPFYAAVPDERRSNHYAPRPPPLGVIVPK